MVTLVNSIKYLKNKYQNPQIFPEKIKVEGTLPNSFYEANITLLPNQKKTLQERKTIDKHPMNTDKKSSTKY